MTVKVKLCSGCEEEKLVEEFHRKRDRPSGRSSQCKDCRNKKANAKNKSMRLRAIEYKGGKCEGCGGEFHPSIYEFHHISPNAEDRKVSSLFNWEAVVKELTKCALLCANCHRLEHYGDVYE